MKRSTIAILVIIIIIIIDQVLKVYIKTNIHYGEEFGIFGLDWARIHFVENEGMAFGISFGGEIGKYALSIFRIVMVGLLIYLLIGLIKAKESKWLVVCFSMIIAGAIGNIIDSMIYGLVFSESSIHSGLAEFMPEGGGYAAFLQGRVVDMLYFPLIDTYWPEWVPGLGGNNFQFFRPVFNIADSAISIGVISILVFHRRFFLGTKKNVEPLPAAKTAPMEEEE